MITADQKVLNENQESRFRHKYAVRVSDMSTKWIQSCPCKTKSAQQTMRSLRTFLNPDGNPRSIYADNSLELIEACEKLNWNHERSAPYTSRRLVGRSILPDDLRTSVQLTIRWANLSFWSRRKFNPKSVKNAFTAGSTISVCP